MMRLVMRSAGWLLRTLLLPLVLPALAGCTVIGSGAGRALDLEAPDLDTLSIGQLQRRPAETPICVLLRDGGRIPGALQSVTNRPLLLTHRELAGRLPAGLRLPMPGETLTVTTVTGTGPMIFSRLALPGERYWIVDRPDAVRPDQPVGLFSPGAGAAPVAIPFDRITRIDWSDGTWVRGTDLAPALPHCGSADPRTVILKTESGSITTVPADDIVGTEAPRHKHAQEIGTVIGLGLDVAACFLTLSVLHSLAAVGL